MKEAKTDNEPKKYVKFFLFFFGVLWLGAIVASFYFLGVYENSPGKLGTIPPKWLKTSQIAITRQKPTLLVFLHPRCPCSQATLGALEIIISRSLNPCEIVVVFYTPKDAKKNWYQTHLFYKTQKISQFLQENELSTTLRIYTDQEAEEAMKFGVKISGTVLLYDKTHALRFHGGITVSRGHFDSGDNFGVNAIVDILANKPNKMIQTPVFGCSIF